MDIHEIRRQLVARQAESVKVPDAQGRTSRWGWRMAACVGAIAFLIILSVIGFWVAALLRETATSDALAPKTGRFIPISSERLFVQEAGPADGQPVLLVHGTGAWSELWRDVMRPLAAAGFRVIAVDLPPFGFSDRPRQGNYDRASQAGRIGALVNALGLRRPLLVGHSFGAGPTVETVMRHPEKVGGLVLIAGALGLTAPPSQGPSPVASMILEVGPVRDAIVATLATNPLMTRVLLKQMVHRRDAADDRRVEVLQRPLALSGSTHDFGIWLRHFISPDTAAMSADRGSYRKLAVRAALIWGDKDTLTPLAQAHDLLALLPASSLTVLPDVGHIPQIEAPAALATALLEALRQLCRPGPRARGADAEARSPC